EAAGVGELADALAHGEPAAIVLAPHLVGAAHLVCQALAPPHLVELILPAHRNRPPDHLSMILARHGGAQTVSDADQRKALRPESLKPWILVHPADDLGHFRCFLIEALSARTPTGDH